MLVIAAGNEWMSDEVPQQTTSTTEPAESSTSSQTTDPVATTATSIGKCERDTDSSHNTNQVVKVLGDPKK